MDTKIKKLVKYVQLEKCNQSIFLKYSITALPRINGYSFFVMQIM